MNYSPTLVVIITLSLLTIGAVFVSAQTDSPQYDAPSASNAQIGSTCEAKAVKHLLAATDPTKRVDQEWNLNTAEAYERLAEMGIKEC